MTNPNDISELSQAVAKLALHNEIMATILRHIESPGITNVVRGRLAFYADEAAQIARQFGTTAEGEHGNV